MANKSQIYLISFLLVLTVILTTRFFQLGMMGLSVFILAYLSKGIRRHSSGSQSIRD